MPLIRIAGLQIGYSTRHPETMDSRLADYASSQTRPDFTVAPQEWMDAIQSTTVQPFSETEFYAIGVAMGEELPTYDRLQTHGVAIEYEGKAYIFSAPSGTGKSTRAFIWQKYLGRDKVSIINGDKPVLWIMENEVLACGSPWCGKEGLQKNVCVPLAGICLLERSEANTIRKASPKEFFDFYITQVQLPKNPERMMKALDLVEQVYHKVPIFALANDMSELGMKVCFEAVTGKNFEDNRI